MGHAFTSDSASDNYPFLELQTKHCPVARIEPAFDLLTYKLFYFRLANHSRVSGGVVVYSILKPDIESNQPVFRFKSYFKIAGLFFSVNYGVIGFLCVFNQF